MASIKATPQGQASVTDIDVNLTSLQMRVLMLCLRHPMNYYDVVKRIQEEPELSLIPIDVISRDTANLVGRGLLIYDREN